MARITIKLRNTSVSAASELPSGYDLTNTVKGLKKWRGLDAGSRPAVPRIKNVHELYTAGSPPDLFARYPVKPDSAGNIKIEMLARVFENSVEDYYFTWKVLATKIIKNPSKLGDTILALADKVKPKAQAHFDAMRKKAKPAAAASKKLAKEAADLHAAAEKKTKARLKVAGVVKVYAYLSSGVKDVFPIEDLELCLKSASKLTDEESSRAEVVETYLNDDKVDAKAALKALRAGKVYTGMDSGGSDAVAMSLVSFAEARKAVNKLNREMDAEEDNSRP